MASRSCAEADIFHSRHGKKVWVSESGRVATRVEGVYDGVVFTARPIPLDTLFQVELLEVDKSHQRRLLGLNYALKIGITTLCPDDNPVPENVGTLYFRDDYWILSEKTVHHNRKSKSITKDMDLEKLRVGQLAGCYLTKDGELFFQVNGKRKIGWTGLPTDKPIWGFVDIYGKDIKIRLLDFENENGDVSLKDQIAQLKDEKFALTQQLQRKSEELAQKQSLTEDQQRKLDQSNLELGKIVSKTQHQISQLEEEKITLEQELEKQNENRQAELQRVENSHEQIVDKLTQELECLNRDFDRVNAELLEIRDAHKEAVKQLSLQIDSSKIKLERSKSELTEVQSSHQHTTEQLTQQLAQLSTDLDEANHELVRLRDNTQHISRELETANQKLGEEKYSCMLVSQQLQDSNFQLEHSKEAFARENTAHEHTIRGLTLQLNEARRELEKVITAQKEASAHDIEPWKVARAKVEVGSEIARGGWGSVSEGMVRVAVKQLHMSIASPRNIERLRREIRILSQVRHPNLIQFIGAVFDEQAERLQAPPLIITELLDTNLRRAYEQNQLSAGKKLSIFKDVAKALNYLHERHDPIIHRDVSAPNVLLEALPGGHWKGKLTDLGSANFAKVAQTLAEGAIIYAAPETIPRAYNPNSAPPPQTFKMDVYSFGVMLCEVTTSSFPDQNEYGDMIIQVQRTCPPMYSLIEMCTKEKQEERPKMSLVLEQLEIFPSEYRL